MSECLNDLVVQTREAAKTLKRVEDHCRSDPRTNWAKGPIQFTSVDLERLASQWEHEGLIEDLVAIFKNFEKLPSLAAADPYTEVRREFARHMVEDLGWHR